jgi:hypothetical protein
LLEQITSSTGWPLFALFEDHRLAKWGESIFATRHGWRRGRVTDYFAGGASGWSWFSNSFHRCCNCSN